MFQGRPISLKVEVWDRIKTYMDDQAGKDRNFQNNTSAVMEEAVIFFLDAKDAEASGGSAEPESTDDMSMDLDMSSDESSEDTSMDAEASTDEEPAMDEEAEPEAEPEAEEEPAEEEAPKPARRSSAKKAKAKKRKK